MDERKKHRKTGHSKNELAHRYLLRFRGFEDTRNVMENRYAYAVYALADIKETKVPEGADKSSTNPEIHDLENYFRRRVEIYRTEYLRSQQEENAIRQEIFAAIRAIENKDSRQVLWMFYVEGMGQVEIAENMGITVKEVAILKKKGLCAMDVPQKFCDQVDKYECGDRK